jgi:tetratricopeptide (TPR) repeat protein
VRASWASLARTGALAAALCAAPGLARADETRERGVRLAREGRCEAALADLAAARAESPRDAELAGLEGECLLRLRRYGEAVRALEAATALAPERAELQLALAKARFHDGDYAAAEQALAHASSVADDAEYELYLGMLRLERGDAAGAAEALERARRRDAARVEPVASYYLGLALARSRRSEQAGLALRHVTDVWAGTDWAREAERRLERLDASPERRIWAAVGSGFEYDDNVVLRGRGSPLPSDISDEGDVRGVWTANAGVELWKRESATLGLMGSYRGTTHADLDEFDAHFPSATLWLDGAITESLSGLFRYDFGYAWLDSDPFVLTQGWLGSLERDWQRYGRSEFFAQAFLDGYFFESDDVPDGVGVPGSVCTDPTQPCGPPGLNEERERERDGLGVSAGLAHSVPLPTGSLPLRGAALRAGYRYTGFDAEGREYSFDSHELHGGLGATLPGAVDFDLTAGYAWRPYRHATTFPDPSDLVDGVQYGLRTTQRRERTTRVELSLGRGFGEHVRLSGHYRYLDNESTADVFDYDQHVVGLMITLGLSSKL